MSLGPIWIDYDGSSHSGRLSPGGDAPIDAWRRIRASARALDAGARVDEDVVEIHWAGVLELIRLFRGDQLRLGFAFRARPAAAPLVERFIREVRQAELSRNEITQTVPVANIDALLSARGWDLGKRELKEYQRKNVSRLLALSHGANFSVPGAGKTTVTLAVHLLAVSSRTPLLVVAPKNAFKAWRDVITECMRSDAADGAADSFVELSGGAATIGALLTSGARRFLINYEQIPGAQDAIGQFLSSRQVHLVLDESHRMKSGHESQRASVLLDLAYLANRRDILSGTPMPQSPRDMQSQLDFLYPGAGLGQKIARGQPPRDVLGQLFVRTTKSDLDLPLRRRIPLAVDMTDAHMALYAILRDELRRQVSAFGQTNRVDVLRARGSVVRLLQASTNPALAVQSMISGGESAHSSALLRTVLDEGPSAKMRAAVETARDLARQGRKVVLWTIFTHTIETLERLAADLNPLVIYGQTPTGAVDDETTREHHIEQFLKERGHPLLIANPAAAGEGISLHTACHDAIYLDRSYNATHWLQSIDRIHRLGLDPATETRIWVFENRTPRGIASIDQSVRRRLAQKVRALQQLLEDPDLHQLALDEESETLDVDESISVQDIDDLIAEIEGRASPPTDDLI